MKGKGSRNSQQLSLVWKLAFTYMGAVVGAGFASGQELMQFFVGLGPQVVPALLLTAGAFAFFGWGILRLSQHYQTEDYGDFLQQLLGKRPAQILDVLTGVFLLGSLGIMFSAAGAVFSEHLALPSQWGILLLGAVVLVVLQARVQGVFWVNTLLMPLKFIIVFLVCALIVGPGKGSFFVEQTWMVYPGITQSWLWAGLLYVSYNLLLALAVLSSMRGGNNSVAVNKAGIIGGLGLGVFAGLIVCALLQEMPQVLTYQVPMLYLAGQVSPGVKILYLFVLGMGILTTAVASAYSLSFRLHRSLKKPYTLILASCIILAMFIAQVGFDSLVGLIYPIFGGAGLILMLGVFWRLVQLYGRPAQRRRFW